MASKLVPIRAAVALAVLLMSGPLPTIAAPEDAPDTYNPNYPRQGLCVYIGAGKGTLFTDLAVNTSLLIHGLAVDDAALEAARQQIADANLFGRVSVEKLPLNPLPYVRDLANLVVIDDLAAPSAKGLTLEEWRCQT